MNLLEYYHKLFNVDVKLLHTEIPNEVILDNVELFFVHKEIKFFGGSDWERFDTDIQGIVNLEDFLITLFVMSTIDYFIKNNLELYSKIYQKHDYPKLGWSGYGPHFEHPMKIFIRRFDIFTELHKRRDEVVELFKEVIKDYNNLQFDLFINKIINNNINSKKHYREFLVLLNETEEEIWKAKMKLIFTIN